MIRKIASPKKISYENLFGVSLILLLFFCFVYVQLCKARYLIGTDFDSVIVELELLGLTPYHLREFFYWGPLKLLKYFGLTSTQSIMIYEISVVCYFLWAALPSINGSIKILLFALLLVLPITVLGLLNIHRQFMAVLLASVFFILKPPARPHGFAVRLLIVGFLHNSIFLLSPIFYFLSFGVEKSGRIFFKIFLSLMVSVPAVAIFFIWGGVPQDYIDLFFREGVKTNTDPILYFAYYLGFSFLLGFIIAKGADYYNLAIFLGFVASFLYLVSGQSSGSRVFLASEFFLVCFVIKNDVYKFRKSYLSVIILIIINVIISFSNSFIFSAMTW